MPICVHCQTPNSDFNLVCKHCQQPLEVTDGATLSQAVGVDDAGKSLRVGSVIGHFRIDALAGRGGMGAVYRAFDLQLQRQVALKLLHFAAVDEGVSLQDSALLKEASLVAHLKHANVVTVYGVFVADGLALMAMEWVEGQTLRTLLATEDLDWQRSADRALQMAAGLAAAHERGIVHGDVKLRNVMLDAEGCVKILDFGLAERLPEVMRLLERDVGLRGTLAYMSPQQLRGEVATPQSDVYAFGVCLYELLAGRRPYAGQSREELLAEMEQKGVTMLRCGSPFLSRLAAHCLAHDLTQRPADMVAVYEELRVWHVARRRRPLFFGAGLVGLLLLALLWMGVRGPKLVEARPGPQSMAVLAIENLTGDPSLDVLGNGLTASISDTLVQSQQAVADTWVVPASEIDDDLRDATALYERYGVRLVLRGDLKYHGEGYLLRLRLLDAQQGRVLRTAQLVFDRGEPLVMNREVLTALAQLVDQSVEEWSVQLLAPPQAWLQYLEALGYRYRYDDAALLLRAEDLLRQVLVQQPNHLATELALAETLRLRWMLEKDAALLEGALVLLDDVRQRRPDLADVQLLYGKLLVEQGFYPQAIDVYQAALMDVADHGGLLYALARAQVLQGSIEAARKTYVLASQAAPYHWIGLTEMAMFYFQRGEFVDAEGVFRKLVELAPENLMAHANLAAVLYYQQRVEAAVAVLDEVILSKPNPWVYANRGSMLFYLGRYELAEQDFRKALELQPRVYLHHGNLGDALRHQGKSADAVYEEAIGLIDEVLAIDPQKPELGTHRALYLAKLGHLDEALAQLEALGEPQTLSETYQRALVLAIVGENERALRLLDDALAQGYPVFEVLREPELARLRQDAAFIKVVAPYRQGQGS